jgi:16S rRNA (cytosine967-C5)-methyltransferase
VRRWQAHYGDDATLGLLRWDQTPPPVYARWRALAEPPAWLQPTSWPEFRIIPAGRWSDIEPLLAAGALYLQDPATLAATGLLDPQPGETVLDLCAAPGGKSLLLADLLAAASRRQDGAPNPPDTAGGIGAGRVVAVDLPDERRVGRLRENLAKVQGVDFAVVEADVLQLSPQLLAERGVPSRYSAVLLDAPCSSTGVMRHRVDVKWRLHEADIATHAREQLALLTAAAKLVAGPDEGGGRLVYSTCSLEPEENAGVVEAFLHAASGRFTLEEARHRRPWEDGSDGVSAFRLRRGK